MRGVVIHAQAHLAGAARLAPRLLAKGFLDGAERWGLDPPGIPCVGPATAHLAVRAEARAQAAAGAGITGGRRGPTVRQGQGQTAWRARLETAGVGIAARTSDD
jgi:hypothetical protein